MFMGPPMVRLAPQSSLAAITCAGTSIVTDRNGTRAGAACRLLKGSGFSNVYQLKGGLSAWQQASLPVEK